MEIFSEDMKSIFEDAEECQNLIDESKDDPETIEMVEEEMKNLSAGN